MRDDCEYLTADRAAAWTDEEPVGSEGSPGPRSVARMRVSVLSSVPAGMGSKRNSMATLIQPGCESHSSPSPSQLSGSRVSLSLSIAVMGSDRGVHCGSGFPAHGGNGRPEAALTQCQCAEGTDA